MISSRINVVLLLNGVFVFFPSVRCMIQFLKMKFCPNCIYISVDNLIINIIINIHQRRNENESSFMELKETFDEIISTHSNKEFITA